MPFKSDAQRRLMYAVARGHARADVPKQVAEEFIAESHGMHTLPKRVGRKKQSLLDGVRRSRD